MTLFEVMIVIAIVGLLSYLSVGAVRWLRGANGIDAAVEVAGVMRRSSQLATGAGEMYRIVLDLDAQQYRVERCSGGSGAITKNPELAAEVEQTEESKKRAVEDARQRLASLPQGALPTDDPERADEMALALAGQLAARRTCTVTTELFGDPDGKGAVRALDPARSAKVRQVWVQHLERPVATGLVAIHFFPLGSAEKAIIEIADGEHVYSVLVHGLTGRVDVQEGAVRDPDAFLFRDATGERTDER